MRQRLRKSIEKNGPTMRTQPVQNTDLDVKKKEPVQFSAVEKTILQVICYAVMCFLWGEIFTKNVYLLSLHFFHTITITDTFT